MKKKYLKDLPTRFQKYIIKEIPTAEYIGYRGEEVTTKKYKNEEIMASIQDIHKILKVILDDITIIKKEVAILKEDVAMLKEDVAVLKKDVAVLKKDVAVLKKDVAAMKNTPTMKKELAMMS